MATAPKIKLRDNSGSTTTDLVFMTNRELIVLEGTVGADTADIQISVNGAPFTSDPTLIGLDLTSFTVPNLATYPSGFTLIPGVNVIALRAIDIVGGVSATSTATITRISRPTNTLQAQIPTGIRVRRRRDAIDILAALPTNSFFSGITPSADPSLSLIGFNVYASSSPSGLTGYYKVNDRALLLPVTYEEQSFTSYADTTSWADSFQKFLRIRVTEEDAFGTQLAERLNQVYDLSVFTGNLRYASSVESYRLAEFVYFRHFRSGGTGIINSEQFVSVLDSDPLYYVVTAVYWDPTTNQEIETAYSQEVLGTPLVIDTAIRDLPGRNQLQIVTAYVNEVTLVNRSISLNPGSTTRDVSIDPFASEAERIWFVVDFVHRSQSFLTLLQIDDVRGVGTSDPVTSSAYKTALGAALGLSGQDNAVQTLIDAQFDKLAANEGRKRLDGRSSVGQAVIFTSKKPTTDLVIPAGTFVSTDADTTNNLPAVRYRVGGSFVMTAAGADAFYNFDTKRYEIIVDIVAEDIGDAGNRPAGSIKNITGVSNVSVTNTEATVFGTDKELNADLAARCQLAYSSVDTGTEGGYASTAAEQIGVIKAKIIKSGDKLMMRDYDDVRRKHIGGKVDVWVQGLRERQVSERFAFSFDIARDITCTIIDLTTLTMRVLDSRVTVDTPIVEILNNPTLGLGVRNVTIGADYDLTGVVIVDYQTFRLNTTIPQPITHIDDVLTVDYRFRYVNQYRFALQPVRRVISVVGEVSGALNPLLGYDLYKDDDPLLTGESTIAKDYLAINQIDGIPSGATLPVNDETHVLIGSTQEPLDSIGINTRTIRVYNEGRTVEFSGPEATAPDFDIIDGGPRTPVKIVRTGSSTIKDGQTVSVDYVHDENLTVTYVVNDLLQELQQVVNGRRHTTADVLVKQAIENQLEIETTIQTTAGATKDKVDPLVRTNVSLELDQKLIGQNVAQSDVIAVINQTDGVDYSPVPYARMAYADGARKLRESILSTFTRLPSLDIAGNRAFILANALLYPTTNGGGTKTEHRGVFQDDEAMTVVSNLLLVATLPKQAYIIGSAGAMITGFTDDTTLTAAGFLTAKDRAAELLRRTANHVVVAISGAALPPDEPINHLYAASYVVRGDKGAHDITATQVEFISMGNFTVSYRSA